METNMESNMESNMEIETLNDLRCIFHSQILSMKLIKHIQETR